jgi:hypothetical protein
MFTKLSPMDVQRHRSANALPAYAEFLQSLSVGEGGRVDVTAAGVGRQTVKNRLNAAASATGTRIKFLRSDEKTLVFEVLGGAEAQVRRRGLPRKAK